MKKHIKNNVSWVGYIDWELEKFHGDEYSIFNGSSQNAYLIEEEKTVLLDTVWLPHRDWFVENLKSEIDLKKIDYIICQHGEQDHSGSLSTLMKEIPNTPIYCTEEAVKSIEGQYGKQGWDIHVVKTGDTLDIGNGKKLIFIEMKMLHWPDSMATYMTGDNILFSMDVFGQHFSVGELFSDLANQCLLNKEAMKYFANIINPFASFVRPKLDEIKEMNLPIDIICPSHGAIFRENIGEVIDTYYKWADAYKEDQITIAYDTMWDGTKKLAHAIAKEINKQSPETTVKVLNISKVDKNEIMTEVFKSKAIAVGSPTCVNDVLTSVAGWLSFLRTLKFKGKKAAAFGCYGWSGESVGIIRDELKKAGFEVVNEEIKTNWNPDESDFEKVPALVKALLSEDNAEGGVKESHDDGATYVCSVCGWTYKESEGAPELGIKPGTKWENIPEDFHCPICKVPKSMIERQGGSVESKDDMKEITGNSAGSRIFKCSVCGWEYNEAEGAPDLGFAPGTKWEDIPDDFHCPICKVPKEKFEEK